MKHEMEKWILFVINCFIGLLWIIIILIPIFFLEDLRQNSFSVPLESIVYPLTFYIAILLIRYPLVQFKKILHSLSHRELFTNENVSRFKKIAYPLFIFAIGSCFLPIGSIQLTVIFFTIKSDTFVFLIMGLAALLMSYIFEEAMKIQNEADELKEETKLII